MSGYIQQLTGIIPHTNKKIDIPVNGNNLIITGGNGSGKTSFLRAIYGKTRLFIVEKQQADLPSEKAKLLQYTKKLESLPKGTHDHDYYSGLSHDCKARIARIESGIQVIIPEYISFSAKHDDNHAVVLYFEDSRLAQIAEATTTQGLQTEIADLRTISKSGKKVGNNLEQHLLNLRTRRSLAITEDHDQQLADTIEQWFKDFEKNLKHLFEDDTVKLVFDSNRYKFSIQQDSKPPTTFQNLSAGYKAIFDVYADLLMRTRYFSISPTELEGVVFIDEIDSHLHISLQRLILPFFIQSFPKVQFIVTTHSPFVLMSTRDILVYDLGKETPYKISQVKSQNEILAEYLNVPTAMPVWAAEKLDEILRRYVSKTTDNISFAELKEELTTAGLEMYFPGSVANILEEKQ